MRFIGIMDCNSFYVSAELIFDLLAAGRPCIVLSNNDGCMIALNKEAKALGLKMGDPAFKLKDFLEENKVKVYSSNYALYGSISDMVTYTLSTLVPELEKYSIDESFFYLYAKSDSELLNKGFEIYHRVLDWNGINTGIGIAKTKTLSKVALKIAKKGNGVCVLNDDEYIKEVLSKFDVNDLWGIGRQYTIFLKYNGIHTAADLLLKSDKWIKDNLTKVGLKLAYELRGIQCYELKENPDLKQNVGNAKSFGHDIKEYETIKEALSTFTVRGAEILRKEGSYARRISIFLQTNPFKPVKQYYPNINIPLSEPTNSSIELLKYMEYGLKKIYKPEYYYKKAGIFLTELTQSVQNNIFYQYNHNTHNSIMSAMDHVNNKYSRDCIKLASQGTKKEWWMRQEKLTPKYTTCWSDILKVKAKKD